jgi:hypothetical protein
MVRTRRYIIMKEASYFPENELYDDAQKQKAVARYSLVNFIHPLLLVLLGLMLLLFLYPSPDHMTFMNRCADRHNLSVEQEYASYETYARWQRAEGQLTQFNGTNAIAPSPFVILPHEDDLSGHTNSTAGVYNSSADVAPVSVDMAAVNRSLAIITPAKNVAYTQWNSTYHDYQKCVEEEVYKHAATAWSLAWALMLVYTIAFLLSLCLREIFLVMLVKREYTATEWKKESPSNTFFIGLMSVLSLLFVAYVLMNVSNRGEYLNGLLARHWTI